jgi:hypothetical protein
VDTGDAVAAVAMNMMVVDDVTHWNTFVIDIVAGGAGTHVVSVSVNGGSNPASYPIALPGTLTQEGKVLYRPEQSASMRRVNGVVIRMRKSWAQTGLKSRLVLNRVAYFGAG